MIKALLLVSASTGETQESINNVSCRCDMTEYCYNQFLFQRRRILKFSFLVPVFQTCDPQGGTSFDPRGIICTTLVEEMLHTKYQSSAPSSFREEEF